MEVSWVLRLSSCKDNCHEIDQVVLISSSFTVHTSVTKLPYLYLTSYILSCVHVRIMPSAPLQPFEQFSQNSLTTNTRTQTMDTQVSLTKQLHTTFFLYVTVVQVNTS